MEEIDFYKYGARVVSEGRLNPRKVAVAVGEKYGANARLEFEVGVSLARAAFEKSVVNEDIPDVKKGIKTVNERSDYERNNSYFGYPGTSQRQDEYGEYIEPTGVVKK